MNRIPKTPEGKNPTKTGAAAAQISNSSEPDPDIREDRVKQARERAREGFYFSTKIYDVIADKLLQERPLIPIRVI